MVQHKSLSLPEAEDMVTSILFDNSNSLYDLKLSKPPRLTKVDLSVAGAIPSLNLTTIDDLSLPKFATIQWVDLMGTLRCLITSASELKNLTRTSFSISRGNLGTLQDDSFTSLVNTTGQILLNPDLESLRMCPKEADMPQMATVMASFHSEIEGVPPSGKSEDRHPTSICPRSTLIRIIEEIHESYSMTFLLGFEIEVTFLNLPDLTPIDRNHAWGTMTAEQWHKTLPLLTEIVEKLEECAIEVYKFHAESGQGQYEFVLRPLEPLRAVDALYQARQIISRTAKKHQVHATFHPWPFLNQGIPEFGSGAHAHLSIQFSDNLLHPSSSNIPDKQEMFSKFWTGVLDSMEAVCAFTMPEAESYKRVTENAWTGGVFIGWGTQNRELPIRISGTLRCEIKCLDGFSNMYLAISSVLAAGLAGLKYSSTSTYQDCPINPSKMSDSQRHEYGITRRLPLALHTALDFLSQNKALNTVMDEDLIKFYVTMKKEEQEKLNTMGEKVAHEWLVMRY
jgi:glutamine synthetase